MGMGTAPRSRSGHGSRRAPMAEINVTPFVDVMLVLLIIFMVAAPLLAAGVPVELPDSRANALPQDREPVTITIAADGTIYLDAEPLPDGQLPEVLTSVCADPALSQVTLRGDRALPYGRVMAVMGELNRSGCNSIALVTNGTEQPPASIAGSDGGP